MGVLHTIFLAAWLVAGATGVQRLVDSGADGGFPVNQDFITREWTWSTGTTTTAFTAYGPSEQVNALDPRDRTPWCPDCELTSSIRSVPSGDVEPVSSR